MCRFFGCLRCDLRRAFISPRFFGALFGMCLLLFLSVSSDLFAASLSDLSVYSLNLVAPLGFTTAAYLLCCIPFSDGFCSDWSSRFSRHNLIRSGLRPYAFSKLISSAVSGGSAIAGAYFFFYLILSFRLPLSHAADAGNMHGEISFAFGSLLQSNRIVLYFLCLVLLHFASGALFASIGFLFSTIILNRYVVWFAPVLVYYFLINLGQTVGLPSLLNVFTLYNGYFNFWGPLPSILYVLALTFVICLLLGWAGLKNIRERLQHE